VSERPPYRDTNLHSNSIHLSNFNCTLSPKIFSHSRAVALVTTKPRLPSFSSASPPLSRLHHSSTLLTLTKYSFVDSFPPLPLPLPSQHSHHHLPFPIYYLSIRIEMLVGNINYCPSRTRVRSLSCASALFFPLVSPSTLLPRTILPGYPHTVSLFSSLIFARPHLHRPRHHHHEVFLTLCDDDDTLRHIDSFKPVDD
jgi:hypothetical protein